MTRKKKKISSRRCSEENLAGRQKERKFFAARHALKGRAGIRSLEKKKGQWSQTVLRKTPYMGRKIREMRGPKGKKTLDYPVSRTKTDASSSRCTKGAVSRKKSIDIRAEVPREGKGYSRFGGRASAERGVHVPQKSFELPGTGPASTCKGRESCGG